MEHRQKKKLTRFLLSAALILAMVFTLAACQPKPVQEEEKKTVENLFTNGDFTEKTGSSAPFIPTGWSGQFGSGIDTSAQENKYTEGVVDTSTSVYDKDQSSWNSVSSASRIPNPGTNTDEPLSKSDDTMVLMIYNRFLLSRGYYNSITAAEKSYYMITVDVRYQENAKPYVGIRGLTSSFIDVAAPATGAPANKWTRFTFYVESSLTTGKSVTLELWNGMDSSTSSSGAVFFDNVYAEKVTYDDYKAAESSTNAKIRNVSLRLPNPDFNSTSSTSTPYYPNDYSTVAGTSKDTTKPSAAGGSNVSYGIVEKDYSYDITAADSTITSVPLALAPNAPDDRVLMLWNKNYTAYGYRATATNAIRAERGQYYAISVWVMTNDLYKVNYMPDLQGSYYKKTDGSYSMITSTFREGQDGLSIREMLRTSASSTSKSYSYIKVIHEDGHLLTSAEIKNDFYTSNGHLLTEEDRNEYTSDNAAFLLKIQTWLDALNADGGESGDAWTNLGLNDNQKLYALKLDGAVKAYDRFIASPSTTTLYNSYSNATSSYKYEANNRYSANDLKLLAGDNSAGGIISLTAGGTVLEIKGINTGGAWQQYTFWIQSNQFNNTDFLISYYLGEGGAADFETHVKGYMFVDTLRMDVRDTDNDASFQAKDFNDPSAQINRGDPKISVIGGTELIASLFSDPGDNMLAPAGDLYGDVKGREEAESSSYHANGTVSAGVKDTAVTADWSGSFDGQNPGLPYTLQGETRVYAINAVNPSIYHLAFVEDYSTRNATGNFEILPYNYYRVSLWVKTAGIPEKSKAALNAALVSYEENKEGKGAYVMIGGGEPKKLSDLGRDANAGETTYDRKELSAITGIATTKESLETETNGWTEIVFYVSGNKNTLSAYLDIEVSFGSGSYTSPDTLALGYAFVAYPSMYQITYKEYNDASTNASTIKKYSFTANNYTPDNTLTNGAFDEIDSENSKIDYDSSYKLWEPGVPGSWTYLEGKPEVVTAETLKRNDLLNGIIDPANRDIVKYLLNNGAINFADIGRSDIANEADLDDLSDDLYRDLVKAYFYDASFTPEKENSILLMSSIYFEDDSLGNKTPKDDQKVNYGYRSSSKYLSANKYYRISVYARLLPGYDPADTEVYIYLAGSNASPFKILYGDNNTARYKVESTEWTEYVFYVEVGQSSVNVSLEFWFGTKDKDSWTKAIVLFDNAVCRELSTKTEGTVDYNDYWFFNKISAYLKASNILNESFPVNAGSYLTAGDEYNDVVYFEKDFEKYMKSSGADGIQTLFALLTYVTDSFDAHGDNVYATENSDIPDDEKDAKEKFLYKPLEWDGSQTKLYDENVSVSDVINKSVVGVIDFTDRNLELLFGDNVSLLSKVEDLRPVAPTAGSSFGNNLLMIYNPRALGYSYTTSSKYLNAKTIYEISVYVKTIDIAQGEYARVNFYVSDYISYEVLFNSDYWSPRIMPNDAYAGDPAPAGYTKLTFYVDNQLTSGISNVKLSVELGNADKGIQGFIAIDEFTIQKFDGDSDAFKAYMDQYIDYYKNTLGAEFKDNKFDTVAFKVIKDPNEIEPKPQEVEPTKPSFAWLIITSSVVGGLTALFVLIYLYQKYRVRITKFLNNKIFKGRLGKRAFTPAYDKQHAYVSPSVSETRKTYDSFTEE